MNEEALVAKITAGFPDSVSTSRSSQLKLGVGDDAALFRPAPGFDTVLTCDWFLEGSHFIRTRNSPESVGWKALARALSDIAAMGGVPRCFLLSLALPTSATGQWMQLFLKGLKQASEEYDCRLVGGDTTRRRDILINISVVGEVRRGRALLRSKAEPGDQIFVSGRLGEAENGLHLASSIRAKNRNGRNTKAAMRRHLKPEPRLALGRWLRESRLASAAMDLSDGLSTDLARLCRASRVGAHLEELGIMAAAVRDPALSPHHRLRLALHGGEDYELLFTVARRAAMRVPRTWGGVALTRIGEITTGSRVYLGGTTGKSILKPLGWDPFAKPLRSR